MAAEPRKWSRKFADAGRGLRRAVGTQKSFAVHVLVAIGVVVAAAACAVSALEWALLIIAIGLVFIAEIINTAIESMSRGPGRRKHPRLRDALDMASAAVLVAAVTAACIGVIVFGSRLLPG